MCNIIKNKVLNVVTKDDTENGAFASGQKCHMLLIEATRRVWPAQGVTKFFSQAR